MKILDVYDFKTTGKVGSFDLESDFVSDCQLNKRFLSFYFVRMKANHLSQRKAKTKNQSEISGTTKKPYKQKGTGNARQGTTRGAQHRGGASMFGPRGELRTVSIPKKEARLARRMIVAEAIRIGRLFVIKDCVLDAYKTKPAVKVLTEFGKLCGLEFLRKKFLVLYGADMDQNFFLSVRNLQNVNCAAAKDVKIFDLWSSDVVLVSESGMRDLLNVI